MENSNKTSAAIIHLSALSQYFIPFGNFIFPVILWSAMKDKSTYIDQQGKQSINFQLSIFMYSLILALIAIPIFLITLFKNFNFNHFPHHGDFNFENINFEHFSGIAIVAISAAFLFCTLKVFEFFLIIYAAAKTSNGFDFKYPLSIKFIK
jgi:uncharacterized Tic20 family protein